MTKKLDVWVRWAVGLAVVLIAVSLVAGSADVALIAFGLAALGLGGMLMSAERDDLDAAADDDRGPVRRWAKASVHGSAYWWIALTLLGGVVLMVSGVVALFR